MKQLNTAKLRRLCGDLDQMIGAQRSLTEHYRETRDEFIELRADVHRRLQMSRHTLDGWSGGDALACLLKFSNADLEKCYLDRSCIKRAVELGDLMADLQSRTAALEAQITPLHQLVGRLKNFVEVHNHE